VGSHFRRTAPSGKEVSQGLLPPESSSRALVCVPRMGASRNDFNTNGHRGRVGQEPFLGRKSATPEGRRKELR